MRAIASFRHLMSSTVSVAPRTGQDGYGKPTYGATTAYRAHLSRKPQLVRTGGGQEVDSRMAAYLDTADPILETSQVTLSTSDVGSTEDTLVHPPIAAVERRFDNAGPHHVVVFFE